MLTKECYLELHRLFVKYFGPDYDRCKAAVLRNAIYNNDNGCGEINTYYRECSQTEWSIWHYDRLQRVIRRCVEAYYD